MEELDPEASKADSSATDPWVQVQEMDGLPHTRRRFMELQREARRARRGRGEEGDWARVPKEVKFTNFELSIGQDELTEESLAGGSLGLQGMGGKSWIVGGGSQG